MIHETPEAQQGQSNLTKSEIDLCGLDPCRKCGRPVPPYRTASYTRKNTPSIFQVCFWCDHHLGAPFRLECNGCHRSVSGHSHPYCPKCRKKYATLTNRTRDTLVHRHHPMDDITAKEFHRELRLLQESKDYWGSEESIAGGGLIARSSMRDVMTTVSDCLYHRPLKSRRIQCSTCGGCQLKDGPACPDCVGGWVLA